MKIHYYLGWFKHSFPDNLCKALQADISDRKSLVTISADPSNYEENGATERSWLNQAGLLFDEYHLINNYIKKEEAQKFIQDASVIFLLGGSIVKLHRFLVAYDLSYLIKKSNAVVIGASAGAINMSAKWLCSKKFGDEITSIYEGIGLDDFSVLSHFDLENHIALVQKELSSLSREIDIYVSNKDCAVRVKDGKIDILGDVYLMSHSKFHILEQTL